MPDPAKLTSVGLTVGEVSDILAENVSNAGGSVVEKGGEVETLAVLHIDVEERETERGRFARGGLLQPKGRPRANHLMSTLFEDRSQVQCDQGSSSRMLPIHRMVYEF